MDSKEVPTVNQEETASPEVSREELSGNGSVPEDEGASDPELEELLDMSLNEFGKHTKPSAPPPKSKATPIIPPSREAEFEQVYGEEFAAQAETQLSEAIDMMRSENPDLWKQFGEFSKSVGMPDASALNIGGGVSTAGVSSGDSSATGGNARESESGSLNSKLEETLKKLKESTEKIESGKEFGDSFGQLDLNSEDNEDQLLKMMQGMMSSLLSRDVLYPSLTELCKQYPEWLETHKSKISQDDYQRYSKQLDIMTVICQEFESQADSSDGSSEKILSLMQQLQQFGQPPAELASASEGAGFLPTGAELPDFQNKNPENCSLM